MHPGYTYHGYTYHGCTYEACPRDVALTVTLTVTLTLTEQVTICRNLGAPSVRTLAEHAPRHTSRACTAP